MKKIQFLVGILSICLFLTSCMGRASDSSKQIIPPNNLQLPIQGTWNVISILKEDARAKNDSMQKLVGQEIYFSEDQILMGDYFIEKSRYQTKNVDAELYYLYHHQAFPAEYNFDDTTIEIITILEDNLYFCELIRLEEDRLILKLFSNSFIIEKASDIVDTSVFTDYQSKQIEKIPQAISEEEINSGILLGLKRALPDAEDSYSYRTMWISVQNKKLLPIQEVENIFFPRRTGFYYMEIHRTERGNQLEDSLEVKNIVVDSNAKISLELEQRETTSREISSKIFRNINYIGNDYISIEINEENKRGDSVHSNNRLQLLAIDSLPSIREINISDIAGEAGRMAMRQGLHELGLELGIDVPYNTRQETNFGLERKMGLWLFRGRTSYYLGSEKLSTMYNIHLIPPTDIIFYNNLNVPWTIVKDEVPSAVDVLTSPNKDIALIITDSEILVYEMEQQNLVKEPMERIPLQDNESVVMAEWSTGSYVKNWGLTLENFIENTNKNRRK